MKGYTLTAIYGTTPNEMRMCSNSKKAAQDRGRKCLVLHGTGPHEGMLCFYQRNDDLVKGETPEHAGKRKMNPGPVVLVGKRGKYGKNRTSFQKKLAGNAQ